MLPRKKVSNMKQSWKTLQEWISSNNTSINSYNKMIEQRKRAIEGLKDPQTIKTLQSEIDSMLISISVLEDQNRSYKRKLSEYGI
jgi:predicted  nucleic acid-binding Zn-ribbon protein